jgi:hypothetical protein
VGVSIHNVIHLGRRADFLHILLSGEIYLAWSDFTWIQKRVCSEFSANLGKDATEILAMIKQVFREESMSHTRMFEWKSRNTSRPKRARQMKSKVKNILIILFDIKGIVYKEFVIVFQIVSSSYYCDVLQ